MAARNPPATTDGPQLLRGTTSDSMKAWITVGFPDAVQSSGRWYYEMVLGKGCATPQVGLLSPEFELRSYARHFEGVGDDEHGFAADGVHAARLHGGKPLPWSVTWPDLRTTEIEK